VNARYWRKADILEVQKLVGLGRTKICEAMEKGLLMLGSGWKPLRVGSKVESEGTRQKYINHINMLLIVSGDTLSAIQ